MLLSRTEYPPVMEWFEKSLSPLFRENHLTSTQLMTAQVICERFANLRMQCECTPPNSRKTIMPLFFRGENALLYFGATLDLIKISRHSETGVTFSFPYNPNIHNEALLKAYLDKAYRMMTEDSIEYPPSYEPKEKLNFFLVHPIGSPKHEKLTLVSSDEYFVYYSIL